MIALKELVRTTVFDWVTRTAWIDPKAIVAVTPDWGFYEFVDGENCRWQGHVFVVHVSGGARVVVRGDTDTFAKEMGWAT